MKGTRTCIGSGIADKPNRCLPVVKEYKRWELNRIRPYLGLIVPIMRGAQNACNNQGTLILHRLDTYWQAKLMTAGLGTPIPSPPSAEPQDIIIKKPMLVLPTEHGFFNSLRPTLTSSSF